MAIIGTNVTVSVQQTLASAKQASAVTLANPGVVTATAHGYSNGDFVVATVTAGMVELDGQVVRVSAAATDSFTLEGLDTSAYSAVVAASTSFKKVTAFQTFSSAQNVTMPNPAPNKIDITTLIDKTKQYTYGLADAPDGTVSGLFSPTGTAEGLIRTATKTNAAMVVKIAFTSLTAVMNANVSGGTGFELQTNQAATATTSFTPIKDVMYY